MEHLPIFLNMKGRGALVVGGDTAAAWKARLLLKAGAAVTVVSPRFENDLLAMERDGRIRLEKRDFVADDVTGRALVIGASGDMHEDTRVFHAAKSAGVPVNVVDRPALSTFTMPAVVERDPITVAISSGGASPLLARSLRSKIEALLPANIGRLARFAERFRGAVKANHPKFDSRRRFWERFFDGPVAAAVLSGDERWAREQMLALVNKEHDEHAMPGMVYMVGAGPGNPDLLTLRALRLLEQADVIVYDRLIGPEILDYARRDAERIYVGKAKGAHVFSQDEINRLVLRLAQAGRQVVRLKGGDPFVFGRGGEERAYLVRHGIRVEVVPGITAATGCAAATGIPLTHRDLAQAAVFVTGHGQAGEPEVDWAALARQRQTIVIYMGASVAGRIASRLIENEMDPATPVSVIINGTRHDQRVEIGVLAELEALSARLEEGPALIVIGDVVRQAEAWTRPMPRQAVAV
jgi:uroporphyrin-III C-methyltransferase/precorrin-2 dehydrogenase/sirohydrochlorin ferrochelatase